MKIYWWQDGIHIEPESAKERVALCNLTELLNLVQIGHGIERSPIGTVETGDQQSVI